MAPQGATRIKKGLPCVCPTGVELGEDLRNTEIFFLNSHIVIVILSGTIPEGDFSTPFHGLYGTMDFTSVLSSARNDRGA